MVIIYNQIEQSYYKIFNMLDTFYVGLMMNYYLLLIIHIIWLLYNIIGCTISFDILEQLVE